MPWYPVRGWAGVGARFPGDQQTFFWSLVQGKDTTRLHPSPVYSTQPTKWGEDNYSKCPPAWLCSGPSCWELGTSGEALILSYRVPGVFGGRTLVKSRRKRSRFCLCEHIFMQLKQHEITLVQWRINPQIQKHQTLGNSTSMTSPDGCLVFSASPSSCPWVWSPPNFQTQFFLYGERG